MTMHAENQWVSVIADTLNAAFEGNPYFDEFFPNAKRRLEQTHWWLSTMTRYGIRYGEVYVANDSEVFCPARKGEINDPPAGEIKGAAVWLDPSDSHPHIPALISAGLIQAPWRIGPAGIWRAINLDGAWNHFHEEHWYLMLLGVNPAFQRHGLGQKLLAPVLDKADKSGTACILETASEASCSFYDVLGFNTIHTSHVEKQPLWILHRPAQAAQISEPTSEPVHGNPN